MTVDNDKNHEDEIDLKQLVLAIWNKKITTLAIFLIFSFLSFFYSLSLKDLYTSSSILTATRSDESLSSKVRSLSPIAGIAGVSFPSADSSLSQEAIAKIKSFDFFSNELLPHIHIKNILAVERWVAKENTIIYDNDIYLDKSDKWLGNIKYPTQPIPSIQKAHREFNKMVGISIDKNTGFVTLSVSHQSPYLAQKWTALIIQKINESMREDEKILAEKSINFLEETIMKTNLQSIKDAISNLLESQIKSLMLVSANENYVYKILDAPIVPELKSSPQRIIIVIIGSILGLILGILISILMFIFRKEN